MEGFKGNVQDCWRFFIVAGRTKFVLATKLKLLKEKLKEWSKNNNGNWKIKKEQVVLQVNTLETVLDQQPLTEDEQLHKANLAMELGEVARHEEIYWRQRFRIQWIMDTTHKRFYSLHFLEVGVTITDPSGVKVVILDFTRICIKNERLGGLIF